jgi:hypothetical protein
MHYVFNCSDCENKFSLEGETTILLRKVHCNISMMIWFVIQAKTFGPQFYNQFSINAVCLQHLSLKII